VGAREAKARWGKERGALRDSPARRTTGMARFWLEVGDGGGGISK